ncbi:hypothetical protein D9V86_02075 [Bacteroidetes/Chlorobi group bacterium ChocPot_Mid]|nr:MAG: hypothetical protein D9V86_02075 [Bacteroidetes/Chlorobi group bacterium ChocPot_Mid]
MEYSELIHELTDGTIEPVREPELFNALASNEELRAEFRQQLAMKSAIRTDAKAFTPAAQSTLNIFSSLGFVPPPVATNSGAGSAANAIVKSSGFFSKFGAAMITGAVAVLTTGIIAYWLFNSELSGLKNENHNLTLALQKETNRNTIPIVKNMVQDNVGNSKDTPEKVKIKYIYIKQPTENNQLTETKKNDNLETDKRDETQSETQTAVNNSQSENTLYKLFDKVNFGFPDYNLSMMNGLLPMNKIANNNEFDESYPIDIRTDLRLSLEILNMQNWFDIAPTITPKEYNKFNNTSVTLFYSLFDDFQVGVDYRRETFFQRFEGKDDKGLLNRYEQQPNFQSAGLVLRYANKDFNLWGVYPFAQVYTGGTNVGLILRGGLGLRYSLMDYLSFVLGANASSLTYNYGGVSWRSNRYDLIYGLSFEF